MSRSRRQPQNLQAIDICDVSAAYVCVCVCVWDKWTDRMVGQPISDKLGTPMQFA